MPKCPSLANPKSSIAPCPSTKMVGCTWAVWVTGTCPSSGCGDSPMYPPLLWQMWVLCLCVDLCHLLQSTDAHTGEKTPHEFTYAHPRCGSLLVAPHTESPRAACRLPVASGRQLWQGAGRGCDASRAISGSDGQGLTAAVFTPVYVSFATNFHAAFILLFRLTPPLVQKSLCNSPVTV